MKRILLIAAIIGVCASMVLPLDFQARFYDKKVYHTGTPVLVKIVLSNDSPQAYRFKLADERVFSVDFDVRSLSNREVDHSETFIRKRNQNQPTFFREVSIEPGEEYSFTENLADYIDLREPGSYVMTVLFYPELYSLNPNAQAIRSNPISLVIRPGSDIPEAQAAIDMDTGENLQLLALPPDQVVAYILDARKKMQWNKFFLYFDLEGYLLQDAAKKRRYELESDAGRIKMLDELRANLMLAKDNGLNLIPSDYTILKTSYTGTDAEVKVLEVFDSKSGGKNYRELREYTYSLWKKAGIWYIYNYTVINKGVE